MKRLLNRKTALVGWLSMGMFMGSCSKNTEIPETAITDSSKNETKVSSLLWCGAASGGTGVFKALEFQKISDMSYSGSSPSPNGSYLKSEADASEGTVWHVRKAPLDRRAEARGATGVNVAVGNTYYIGFRFKLGQVPTSGDGTYHVVFQWKAYGTPMTQNIPLDFIYRGGHMYLTYRADHIVGWACDIFPEMRASFGFVSKGAFQV
ncbi:polysaccharide lyase [Desertivirga xinjiangensis]|uniref:polysaccharide lyase n=1 Tax=Desertivirga xinjiangensis TaxID=539206 RepID=UPI00210EB0DA|nr:polysaccharide lyase [Pedobacter xinjiangensis]